ncbi:FAD-binding domain-containing protein [Primorskyibacter sp. S187A]|uniref:FAD-binding domain-containing protein n=1 Tax=Primorskyibacter sp. S187A TaxID=3415130 RepID=UPI003C7CE7EF
MATLLWFKRDLRLADNPALTHALALGGPVACVYITEPELWAQPDMSARHWLFLRASLQDLNNDLQSRLIFRTGDAVQVLEDLRCALGVTQLVSHEETGNLWTFARDRRVAAWARGQGVTWRELPQCGVVRRLPTRDRWAATRDGFMRQPLSPVPTFTPLSAPSDPLPEAAELGLAPDGLQDVQPGGRRAALSTLGGFLSARGRTYRKDMSSPLQGASACSRLSPHLAYGTLSVREAVQACAARQQEVKGTRDGWTGSLKSFQSRLAWRDHFMQKLEDAPRIETHCLHPAYEDIRQDDPTKRRAWERGETGLPFIDACMRSLIATGWLNFRMRSMLMSFASYHLWLDWRATGPHLARMFTDYEPGIHWSQVQMQSNTTGINTPRIYNPIKQGHDQDPTGAFTRAWLPELAAVPNAHLQEPWSWGQAATLRYPAPIVDVPTAGKRAREMIFGVRRGPDFRETAEHIVEKHASRKDRARRFVRDPLPKRTSSARKKPDDRQLKLDL